MARDSLSGNSEPVTHRNQPLKYFISNLIPKPQHLIVGMVNFIELISTGLVRGN